VAHANARPQRRRRLRRHRQHLRAMSTRAMVPEIAPAAATRALLDELRR
jgi:hypothetical protein